MFRNTRPTSACQVLPRHCVAAAKDAHLTLRLNATNLGDEQYVDRVGGGHYIPGPRRAIQLTTGIGF